MQEISAIWAFIAAGFSALCGILGSRWLSRQEEDLRRLNLRQDAVEQRVGTLETTCVRKPGCDVRHDLVGQRFDREHERTTKIADDVTNVKDRITRLERKEKF